MALTDEQRARLKKLLAASALIIRVRVERFVERATSPEVMAEIEAALQAGDQTAAMSIIQAQMETLRPAVFEAFIDAGKAAAEEAAAGGLGAGTGPAAGGAAAEAGGAGGAGGGGAMFSDSGDFMSRIGIVFDPTNPRAASMVRNETELFLKDMTDTQIAATRAALANAFDKGLGPRATAQAIRNSIGLTEYQLSIVDNYEKSLRTGSARALTYRLRNQARDKTVEDAISGGRPLPEKLITDLVEKYRLKRLADRAETIARTESTRVTSQAREETYVQIAQKLGIGHNRLIRQWNATEDDRTREWHWSMDGDEAALGQPFIDGLGNALMYPGDPDAPAETVCNCRCAMTFRIAE